MSKSFYFDAKENKWKSVRGHNCAGAVWVDDATEDEIRAHLAKIPELTDALAEIERLKAEVGRWRKESLSKDDARLNLRSAADSIKYWTKQAFVKDKLIEQMREALEYALTEARSTECERLIKAALSAERGEG